jgi:XTP/dITP diphosphohydrolase
VTQLKKIVLASGNAGKLREFNALFEPLHVELISQASLQIPDAPEPHPTFVENALAKARHASLLSGLPAIADDSGICVTALGGEPGIHSARYAQASDGSRSDTANNQKLIQSLQGIADRRAWYVAVLVLVTRPDDPQPVIAEGMWSGKLIDTPRGDHGFGYDPFFYLSEHDCTAAELSPDIKNRTSHRGRAMQSMIQQLQSRGLIAALAD